MHGKRAEGRWEAGVGPQGRGAEEVREKEGAGGEFGVGKGWEGKRLGRGGGWCDGHGWSWDGVW